MGKDKAIEQAAGSLKTPPSDLLFKVAPLIVGLICLAICYVLFKKFQTLSNQKEHISTLEKQINTNIKEQTEFNTINNKKFNAVMSQLNQVTYLVQNNMERQQNSIDTQSSPNRDSSVDVIGESQNKQENIKQPVQREFMPTTVIGNFPVEKGEKLPPPMNTTVKKDTLNTNSVIMPDVKEKQQNGKKIIDLQTLKEEVVIEEASSDDEAN